MIWRAALISLLLACSLQAGAVEIGGARFDERALLGGSQLQLNGAGLRTKFMLKVYAVGLYLPNKAATPAEVFASRGPRRIQIITLRELTAEQLSEALLDFMRRNQSDLELQKVQSRIDSLQQTMLGIGKVPAKTTIRLDYISGQGTRVLVGGEQKGNDIPGEDFNQALLKIWLGEHVPQVSVREALLGQPQ